MADLKKSAYSPDQVRDFFAWSAWLDRFALRPLSHMASNWEATWDHNEQRYASEPDSFAEDLNVVIEQIANAERPHSYHDNEDILAQATLQDLKWPIQKKGKLWVGADYQSILEQGAFRDIGQRNLAMAANGRVHAAMDFGQMHFDDMEMGHLNMLAALITITIYHRDCNGESLLYEDEDDECST